MRHRLATTLVIPVALLGLSACRSAPHAGAAAVVGSDRIDYDTVVRLTDAAYVGQAALSATRADFQRQVVGRLVDRQLDEAVAAELGVTVNAAEVQASIRQAEQAAGGRQALEARLTGAGVGVGELTDLARDIALRGAIAQKLIEANPPTEALLQQTYQTNQGQFQTSHVAHILVKDQATAARIKAQLDADPSQFAALAKANSIDTSNKATGGDLGTQPRGTFVQQFEDAVYAAKAGQIIGPVQTQFGFHVIKVIALTVQTFAQVHDQLQAQLKSPQGTYAGQLLTARLAQAGKRLGVHVSSRIGSWDAATAQVNAPSTDPKTATSVQPGTNPEASANAALTGG